MIFNQTGGGGSPELQTKTVGPSTSQQLIVPDTGFDGLSQVTVTPALLETKSVTPSTSQQTITPSSGYYGMGQVTVSGARLQSKTVTPSALAQTVTADSGYLGLSQVTVNAISGVANLVPVTRAAHSAGRQYIVLNTSFDFTGKTIVGLVGSLYCEDADGTAYQFAFSAPLKFSGMPSDYEVCQFMQEPVNNSEVCYGILKRSNVSYQLLLYTGLYNSSRGYPTLSTTPFESFSNFVPPVSTVRVPRDSDITSSFDEGATAFPSPLCILVT